MKRFISKALFLAAPLSLFGASLEGELPSLLETSYTQHYKPKITIQNRPLAKVNGKVISLYDVVKKMDLYLFDYYPTYTPSEKELFQFYSSRWQTTLDDMIGEELILLDAAVKEIVISDGAIREELERRFGPHLISNLDKVNLQYEEARELVRNDLMIQQLIGMKVHSKILQMITPQVIKQAYESYLKAHPADDEYCYRVLSISGEDREKCMQVAEVACETLKKSHEPLESSIGELESEGVSLTLSDRFKGPSTKISESHLEVIRTLSSHEYSAPITQISRFDQRPIVRIFHLEEVNRQQPKSFEEMHDTLKNELLFKASDQEKAAYIKALKVRFGYDKEDPKYQLPEDYHPFALI